jgi:ribonucleoside-diphosphate reductase alpha chain
MDIFSAPSGSVDALVGATVDVWMQENDRAEAAGRKRAPHAHGSFQNQEDAPPCANCGSITVRAGSCYSCPNCGNTSGCG